MKYKKLFVAVVIYFAIGPAKPMSMRDLFDSVNAESNFSSPAAVQGQTMNFYSGGSLFMRAPRKTYQIVNFTPPSLSAGCGGISLYAGGFSFINEEQFVSMLRNIGSNALGYGFKLAIQNLCPTCDNVMQALESTARMMNRLNIDSCEAAKGIVNASVPDSWSKDKTNSAKMFGVTSNDYSDVTEAWGKVSTSFSAQNDQINKQKQRSPDTADSLPEGNIVWKALKKLSGLDDDYRMIIMSMVGTTILPTDDSKQAQSFERKPISLETLIGGNLYDSASNSPIDEISVGIWNCADNKTDCLVLEDKDIKIQSFRSMVRAKLWEITDKISTRSQYSDPRDIYRFLSATDIPVYKMIAVAASLNNTTLADSLLNRYIELIAAKYAETYIKMVAADYRAAVTRFLAQASPSVAQSFGESKAAVDKIESDARDLVAQAYSRTSNTFLIAQEVAHMERALTANMSQSLRASITFGSSLQK